MTESSAASALPESPDPPESLKALKPGIPFGRRTLGRAGLRVGPLAVSSGYKLGGDGVAVAREAGVDFFHTSTGAPAGFHAELRRAARADRGAVVLALHTYARLGGFVRRSVEKGLAQLGIDHFDILYLGYWQSRPWRRVVDAALQLRDEGKVRHLGIACHNRPLFETLWEMDVFDVMMVRYNAVHRGAEREVFPKLPAGEAGGGRAGGGGAGGGSGPATGGNENPAALPDAKPRGPGVTVYTGTRWGDLLDPAKMPEGETPPTAADCYRFQLSHPRVDCAFTAPRTAEQMREALRAIELGALTEAEAARMRRIGDHIHARYKKLFLG